MSERIWTPFVGIMIRVGSRVDRDPSRLERDRRVRHHGRAGRDPVDDRVARSLEIVDDLDAKAVLLERDGSVSKRLLVRERCEAIGCRQGGHEVSFVETEDWPWAPPLAPGGCPGLLPGPPLARQATAG